MDHRHILRVVLLSGPGKVERPRDDRLSIDDHELVVGDRMGCVDLDRYPVVSEEGR